MPDSPYAVPVKQALQFLSRTCSVFQEEDSGYSPDPGMFTVAQQVAHVAQTIDWFMDGGFSGKGFDLDFSAHHDEVRSFTSLKDAFIRLAQSVDNAATILGNQTAEQMMEPLPDGPIMPGEPKAAIVGAIAEHTAHHRGALSVYARLLGYAPPMPYSE
jgi:uncharacterized damage-inducible protein DinB